MNFDVTSFILGLSIGALLTLAVCFPRVGRILARSLSAVLLAAGAGLLGWVIYAAIRDEPLTPMGWAAVTIAQPSEAIGWAIGLLIGGITALALSFTARSH
jgi:hypothetical protein